MHREMGGADGPGRAKYISEEVILSKGGRLASLDSNLESARREMVERFTRIPGLGRSRAERIYDAGYTNPGMLQRATVEELTRIPGVGVSLARCIKRNIDAGLAGGDLGGGAPGPAKCEEGVGRVVVGETRVGPPETVPSAPRPDDAPAQKLSEPGKGEDGRQRPAPPGQRGFIASLFGRILGGARNGERSDSAGQERPAAGPEAVGGGLGAPAPGASSAGGGAQSAPGQGAAGGEGGGPEDAAGNSAGSAGAASQGGAGGETGEASPRPEAGKGAGEHPDAGGASASAPAREDERRREGGGVPDDWVRSKPGGEGGGGEGRA
ncbi:MAG: helix-hairpin-helix domain-containing protein [Thermoplasmatota archaeon]